MSRQSKILTLADITSETHKKRLYTISSNALFNHFAYLKDNFAWKVILAYFEQVYYYHFLQI